ncbi:MAG TPA: CSLREA domain-containing protein [Candidatus Angelobacter sp.]|nr:CSLREA domain-containing protein [Candidatus Angelobacter sp.]
MQDSQAIKVNHTGNSPAVQTLVAGNAQPLSSISADIDEDGVADLLAGYSTAAGGVVVLHRGNLDAFAPQSNKSFLAIARGDFPSPFLPDAHVFNVPVRPDFIATGHFIGSGHLDLVIASRGGNALYVLPGDGKGRFTSPQVVQLSGAVTALAVGDLGKSGPFSNLIIGLSNKQNSSLAVYRGAVTGLVQLASYRLTASVSSIAFGDLDGDRHADAAILTGGQVQILHSFSMQMETISLPVSAVSMALGSFIHDRGLRLQIALLAADGSIHIAAPSSFDSHAFTPAEAKAMRLASLRRQPNPLIAQQAAAFNEGWNIVESFAAVAPFSDPASVPVLLRTRISSHSTDDIMVFNPAASQMAVISHANVQAGATSFVPGAVSVRSYSGSPVTALSARVNVDGRPGVVLLHDGHVAPFVMMPLPDPTFTVNTTADTITANGCAPGNPNTCSLREAIIEANASAGSDTIMVPAGTYQLTIAPAAGADPHDATTGDLDITDAVSIVGANSATTIVEAGTSAGSGIDKIFSINPQGLGAGFDTSISNLTLRFGTNPFAAGTGDQFGGALDWSAGFDGAGNLTITSCVITDNNTTDGDGGGLSLSNPGGSGTVTISNSTIQNNAANTATTGNGGVGGGILVGSFTSLTLTNSQLLNNLATQTTGAQGKGGAINLGAFSHSNIHGTTISGNHAAGDGGAIWTNQGLTIDQGSVITSNTAGGNGGGLWSDNQDVDVTSLSKVTITGNNATGNGGGIHIDASSPQVLHLNFSRIVGNLAAAGTGLDNINGTVDATDSWWGCNQGPSTAPCDTINDPNTGVTFDPFIVLSHTANPAAIPVGGTSTLTASFLQDNHGTAIAVGNLSVLIGLPIQFNNPILGTLSNQQTSIQSSGTATATYTATAAGAGHADAVVDNATVTANITNVGPPSIAKAFGAANILLSGSTSLTFTITNTNPVALTGVAFTDSLPSGLVVSTPNGVTGSCGGGTITATAGSGSVSLAGATVAASGSCMFSVNVTGTTSGNKVNTTGAVTSANGGTGNTATASIVVLDRPDLTITKTHTGNFTPGQVGATYTITVSNVGTGATVGTVTVVDTLPTGLTATNIAGTGWACVLNTLTCTRADVLNGGASYPAITLTVNVASNVGGTVTNTVTVSGGGELNIANDTASDPTHTGSAALQITTNGSNLTVVAGSTTSTTFTVDAASGLGTITFACSGLPVGASCSFNPASENQISATVTMTVSTTAGSAALQPFENHGSTPIYAVLLPFLGLAGLTFRGKKGKAARLRLALVLGGLMMVFSLVSCGGRGNVQNGTPAGTFPFSVTASSGATSASATMNLTVLSQGPQH